MPQNDKALLLRLQEQHVEFVIIGGVCGVLHGVSLIDAIIAAKQAVARDKDLAAVKQLRAIKEKLTKPPSNPHSEI